MEDIKKNSFLTRARAFGNNGIFDRDPSAVGIRVESFDFGFAPSSGSAKSSEQRQVRLFRRFAAHSSWEAARLLLRACSGANITRPKSVAEIFPFVDDGALSKVGQQLGQLLLHLLADFGGCEFLVLAKQLVDFVGDLLGVRLVVGGNKRREFGTLHRVVDGHEVGVEVIRAEKLHHRVRILGRIGGRGRRGNDVVEVFLERRDGFLVDGRLEKVELRLDEAPSVGDGHGGGGGERGGEDDDKSEGECGGHFDGFCVGGGRGRGKVCLFVCFFFKEGEGVEVLVAEC